MPRCASTKAVSHVRFAVADSALRLLNCVSSTPSRNPILEETTQSTH